MTFTVTLYSNRSSRETDQEEGRSSISVAPSGTNATLVIRHYGSLL